MSLPLQVERHVGVVQEVVGEVLLDHVALVAEADHEVGEAVLAVDLHDVPEDRVLADLGHRLGLDLRLLRRGACPDPPARMTTFMRPPLVLGSGVLSCATRRASVSPNGQLRRILRQRLGMRTAQRPEERTSLRPGSEAQDEREHEVRRDRREDQRVEAVEHAAVAGDAAAGVLDLHVALHEALEQVAERAGDGDHGAEHERVGRVRAACRGR